MAFDSKHSSVVRPSSVCALGLSIVLAGSLFSVAAVPTVASAATSQELQSELDSARAELESLEGQLQSATRDLEIAQAELEETEANIETLSSEIEENEEQLADSRGALGSMMTETYKYDGSLLSFVLGSSSFDELTSRVFYANRFSDTLSGLVEEVVTLQDELNAQMGELEQQRAQQQEQTEALAANAASYQDARDQQASYVSSLSTEVQEALEAERQAEEERQRQEAEAAMEAEREEEQSLGGSSNGGGTSNGGGGGTSNGGGGGSSNGGGGGSSSKPSRPSSTKQAAVNAAMSVLGVDYVTGGDSPSEGFDCSGLVWWAYGQAGASIPRSQGSGMYPRVRNSGTWTTNPANLSVGDLVFYSYNGGASTYHVAMYIGGNQVIHANGVDVCITGIYYDTGFIGGGSIL